MTKDFAGNIDPIYQQQLTRLQLLRRAGAGLATAGLGSAVLAPAAEARRFGSALESASPATFTVFGIDVMTLPGIQKQFKQATGMNIKFTFIPDLTGVFVQKVVKGGVADNFDLLTIDGGVQNLLAPRGYFLAPDTKKVPGWSKIPKPIINNPQMTYQGKPFGVPAAYNADSIAYYPKDLGTVNSWKVIFDDNRTLGKVSMEDNWLTSLPIAATYLAGNRLAKINDPSNMTPSEVKTVVDFLIQRKKAGQFRALWSTWEEAVNLLGTREVVAMSTWEPVPIALQQKGKKVLYSACKEGYNKWMLGWWIPRGAQKHNALDNVYKALGFFNGGWYAAQMAIQRGYATGRPDLGVQYVSQHAHEFTASQKKAVHIKAQEVKTKFKSKYFWENAAPTHLDVIQSEWERFKSS